MGWKKTTANAAQQRRREFSPGGESGGGDSALGRPRSSAAGRRLDKATPEMGASGPKTRRWPLREAPKRSGREAGRRWDFRCTSVQSSSRHGASCPLRGEQEWGSAWRQEQESEKNSRRGGRSARWQTTRDGKALPNTCMTLAVIASTSSTRRRRGVPIWCCIISSESDDNYNRTRPARQCFPVQGDPHENR